MESGFCPAGTPIVSVNESGSSVRPPNSDKHLPPVEGLFDDREAKEESSEEIRSKQVGAWEELARKLKELEGKVAEHCDDQHDKNVKHPFVLKAPERMTKDQ